MIAMAPSPSAVTTRLPEPWRTSPAAETPGTLLSRNVTVKRNYAADLPPIGVFGNTMNQVWSNIIDNAIDATDGKGPIVIRTRRDAGHMVVEIEDNGPGISPENLACIFEPFFTTKPQGQGTSLSLDTAWRIVTEDHGGMIAVELAPGRRIFRISLPISLSQPKHESASLTGT